MPAFISLLYFMFDFNKNQHKGKAVKGHLHHYIHLYI